MFARSKGNGLDVYMIGFIVLMLLLLFGIPLIIAL